MGKSGTNRTSREGVRTQQPQVLFAGLGDAFLTPPANAGRGYLADAGHGSYAAKGRDDSICLLNSSFHAPILGAPKMESNRWGEQNYEYAIPMNLKDRLKMAMDGPPRVSQAALARACKVSPPSVNDWLSGKTKRMGGVNLLRVSQFLNVSPTWLATGRGDPYTNSGEDGVKGVVSVLGDESQLQRPDPATLAKADWWVGIFETARSARYDELERWSVLADVYDRIISDGGKLSAEHHAEYLRRVEELTIARGNDERSKRLEGAD